MIDLSHTIKTPWKMGELIRPLLLTFILIVGTNVILRFIHFEAFFSASPYQSIMTFGLFAIQETFFLGPLFFFLRHYRLDAETLGFRHVGFWKTISLILKAIGLQFIFGLFFFMVIGTKQIYGFLPQENYLPLFGGNTNFDIFIAFIVLVLFSPLVEEIAFRGIILQSSIQSWGYRMGNIFTALLFTLVHFQFGSFFLILVPSLILNWIFIKSRSVIPSLAFHIFNNLLAFVVQWLLFTGKFPTEGIQL